MLQLLIRFLAGYALAALMLSVGLMTSRAVYRDVASRWQLLLRALAVLWIGVPVLAIIVVALLRVPPLGTVTLLMMAICPGVPLVLKSTSKAHGSGRTALLVLLATAITAPLMIPVWTAVLSRTSRFTLLIEPIDVLRVVAPSVIIPFVIGRIINVMSERVALALAKVANLVFIVGILILLGFMLSKAVPVLAATSLRAVIALVIVTDAAFVLGYVAGRPRAADQTALGYAAALGNPALALAVAARSFPGDALPLIAAYVIARTVILIPVGLWLKRRTSADGGAAFAA